MYYLTLLFQVASIFFLFLRKPQIAKGLSSGSFFAVSFIIIFW